MNLKWRLKAPNDESSNVLYAIGDIHGCAHELGLLISKIAPGASDTVVFLGDYIDRGPDSKNVIEQILRLSKITNVVTLKGNHEALFLDFLESPQSVGAGLFILNGGAATIASYAGPGGTFEIPQSHIDFLYALKLMHETEHHYFVHAGVPLKPLSQIDLKNDEQFLLWTRQPFLSSDFKWEKRIVHGHTPVKDVELKVNRINIDTGCVYDGFLTAIELTTGRLIQIERDRDYAAASKTASPDVDRVAVRFAGRLPVYVRNDQQKTLQFETLNYNQFGILMKEASSRMAADPILVVGEHVTGVIGANTQTAIQFEGVIARIETRKEMRLYGVRLERVTNGNDGREWIERAGVTKRN